MNSQLRWSSLCAALIASSVAFAAPAIAEPRVTPTSLSMRVADAGDDEPDEDAEGEEDADLKEAKEHFGRAEKLFALGKFQAALKRYEAAYEAKALPEFLFNIGQCHRNLGNHREAVFSFRKYLKERPKAKNRKAVEKLIVEIDAKIKAEEEKERRRKVKTPPPTGKPSTGSTPVYKKWWFWTGIGAVAAAGGTVYVISSQSGGVPGSDLGNIDFGP